MIYCEICEQPVEFIAVDGRWLSRTEVIEAKYKPGNIIPCSDPGSFHKYCSKHAFLPEGDLREPQ